MTTQASYNGSLLDAQYLGNEKFNNLPTVADVYAAMADNDDTVITWPAESQGAAALPPSAVQVYIHSGGDITSAAAATRAMSNGDLATIEVDIEGNGRWTKFSHSFTGLTAANATPAEIAASINADAQKVVKAFDNEGSYIQNAQGYNGYSLNQLVRAVASLTANAVTLFPILPRSKVRVTVQPAVLGFAGTADYSKRTYTMQVMALTGGTGWVVTYNADTRALTVKNETGGAVNRVFIIVRA
jgi:hypothetical protein